MAGLCSLTPCHQHSDTFPMAVPARLFISGLGSSRAFYWKRKKHVTEDQRNLSAEGWHACPRGKELMRSILERSFPDAVSLDSFFFFFSAGEWDYSREEVRGIKMFMDN